MCTILNIYFKNMIQYRRQLNKCIGDDTRTMNCTGRKHAGHPLWLPLCDTARTSKCIRNKCIGDDTKDAARQSLNCIKTKKYIWYMRNTVYPLMPTLKPQSNGPLCNNTVIGTLAVDGWDVTFGTARRGLGGLGPRPVPSSLYQM